MQQRKDGQNKINHKMVDLNITLSIISLNVNSLNNFIKGSDYQIG